MDLEWGPHDGSPTREGAGTEIAACFGLVQHLRSVYCLSLNCLEEVHVGRGMTESITKYVEHRWLPRCFMTEEKPCFLLKWL
jgi:hypothetical protein